MKKISHWARNHKWPSRIIIVASFILLNGLGAITGMLLGEINISLSTTAMVVFLCLFLVGVAAYPSKSQGKKSRSRAKAYIRQKSCDLLLVATTFCMIVYFGNHPGKLFQNYSPLHATVTSNKSFPKDSTIKTYKTIGSFSASLKDENGKSLKAKEKKKLLKEQIRGIKKATDMTKGEKALLIVLSVLVATGLFILVAALACSLSCGGSDGAALLVGIGGTGIIIFLLVLVLKSIHEKYKKDVAAREKTG